MPRKATYPLNLRKPLGGDTLPLRDRAARQAKTLRNLRDKAAFGANEIHAGDLHTQCLPLVSNGKQAECLPTGRKSLLKIRVMEIGHRIKQAREAVNLSQRELAHNIGVSGGLVGAWESHKKKPGRELLPKLSEELEVSINYLLGQEESSEQKLSTSDPDEISIIRFYRKLNDIQKQNFAQLISMSLDVRREIEHKRRPTKGEPVS